MTNSDSAEAFEFSSSHAAGVCIQSVTYLASYLRSFPNHLLFTEAESWVTRKALPQIPQHVPGEWLPALGAAAAAAGIVSGLAVLPAATALLGSVLHTVLLLRLLDRT